MRLKLFDQLVVLVILYGCEIRGVNKIDKHEELHFKYWIYFTSETINT